MGWRARFTPPGRIAIVRRCDMVAQVSTIPYAARCLTIIASAIALSTSVSAKPEVENDAATATAEKEVEAAEVAEA